MSIANVLEKTTNNPIYKRNKERSFEELINESWEIIAPFWPLKNLIAVNPLKGLEDLPFEEAWIQSKAYFQQKSLPKPMEAINRETIKWLQAYLDQGQATIEMPQRKLGLYSAWKALVIYDKNLHFKDLKKISWLNSLPDSPKETIAKCLKLLKIPQDETTQFLKLLLTTLHGWASYIKYLNEWAKETDNNSYSVSQIDYLCMRLVITYLLWPKGGELINWYKSGLQLLKENKNPLTEIEQAEKTYQTFLVHQLKKQKLIKNSTPSAQFVFCIDVRSEPFRKSLEATGNYETFGFAGFFGIASQITNLTTQDTYASCPVLLKPKHEIKEFPSCPKDLALDQKRFNRLTGIKKLYQSIKYNFITPFALAEWLGIFSGAWTGLRTLSPTLAFKLQKVISNLFRKPMNTTQTVDNISFEDQCTYAEGALRLMGLTERFAPLIIFCGHGSSTQNNAYASSLDCGACGGNRGSSNARILAQIMNKPEVKKHLAKRGIFIPQTTQFIGAEHNTTTDEVTLFHSDASDSLTQIKHDLEKAREYNNILRLRKMKLTFQGSLPKNYIKRNSHDWAQVRPEWGLAKNAAFIAAPRGLTRSLDLDGRCFLHSYDYSKDFDGKFLQTILTAPMVVAQWINSQYLFSTLDNIAFGGGSKVTKNITGKIGVMQGNASDLMTGLSLQSVYLTDKTKYHDPQRLLTIVYAPQEKIDSVIQAEPVLQKLFGNGWAQLVCIEPKNHAIYRLQRSLKWEKAD